MRDTPLIERTYDVLLPSGRRGRVKVFDMNLNMACGGNNYIQLDDNSWILAKYLKVIRPTRKVREAKDEIDMR